MRDPNSKVIFRERMMTDLPTYLSDAARVDSAAIQPLPGSRKVYVQGSRSDLRVPMREITVQDTPTEMGGEKNPPVVVYDTSGIYTDPEATIDLRKGLPAIRAAWIAERGDVEQLDGYTSEFTRRRMKDPQLDPLRFMDERKPLRARSEERRVGKECRTRWAAYHEKKKA